MSAIFDSRYDPFSVALTKVVAKVEENSLSVRQAFCLYVEFSDGESGRVDLTKHLTGAHGLLTTRWGSGYPFERAYLGTKGRAVVWSDSVDFAASFIYEEMFRQRYSAASGKEWILDQRVETQKYFDGIQKEVAELEKQLKEKKTLLQAARLKIYEQDEMIKNARRNEAAFKADFDAVTMLKKPSTMEEALEIFRDNGVLCHIDSSNYMFLWDMFRVKKDIGEKQ